MLSVTKLWVRSFDLDHLDVFWEIGSVNGPARDDLPHPILDYEFYVLRSGDSPLGPYTQVAGPLRDQYMVRDNTVSLLHKWRQYFYKIKAVHKPTGEESESAPSSSSIPPPNLEAAEIIRLEDVYFRQLVGRKCWLFPVRTFGPRCSCWDPTLGRRTRSNHLPCFGTGFLGGFMYPIEAWIQIDPPGKGSTASSLQEIQQTDSSARMISFPPVSPNDIIVEPHNVRWRVIKVSHTERLRSPVHQEMVIHQIPIGDIEYGLPINVDPRTLEVVDPRNFTNPTHLGRDDDYSDIFSVFGKNPLR